MYAQNDNKLKFLLELHGSHLFSNWQINGVEAKVFIESAYPKIVFNETFVKKYLKQLNVKLEEPNQDSYFALWGSDKKYKISYFIHDSLFVNGRKLKIDALVLDFAGVNETYKNIDVVFPIYDLEGNIKIDIKERYMEIIDSIDYTSEGFFSYSMKKDTIIKTHYISTNLKAFDRFGGKEELYGDFLLDLGAGNAFVLNKNNPNVADFTEKSERMDLKDTTLYKRNGLTDLSIIMPNKIQIGDVEIEDSFIAAMKLFTYRSTYFVGTLGIQFFEHFIIIFDVKNDKFYFKPNSDKVRINK